MNEMLHEGRLVKVMCIEPKGVWAMVRVKGYGATMPFVVRVKELRQPTPHEANNRNVHDMGEVNGVKLTYVDGNVFATPSRRR